MIDCLSTATIVIRQFIRCNKPVRLDSETKIIINHLKFRLDQAPHAGWVMHSFFTMVWFPWSKYLGLKTSFKFAEINSDIGNKSDKNGSSGSGGQKWADSYITSLSGHQLVACFQVFRVSLTQVWWLWTKVYGP